MKKIQKRIKVLIGEAEVGKTQIIHQLINQSFNKEYIMTLSVDRY